MEFKELSQRDPKWSSVKLGYGNGTIGSYGCTLTCLAMFADLRPDILNKMLKGSSYETSAFAGSSKNLINWLKLESLTNGRIKFHWRGGGYDRDEIQDSIEQWGACLVEVDFDGTGPKGDKHWILAKGNKLANDPWTGNEIPTNKYSDWTGWAEIEVNRGEDMASALEVCMADRKKFWAERDEARAQRDEANRQLKIAKKEKDIITGERDIAREQLEISNKEISRLEKEITDHVCPVLIDPVDEAKYREDGMSRSYIVDGVTINKNYAIK